MKKNYFFTFLLTLFFVSITFGQTTLSAGDIVIIEMQGDSPDGFRFIPLVDLAEGTVIRFTDNGWTGSAIRSGEGTVIYTAPTGGVRAGENIRYTVGDGGDFSLDGSDINISSSGDQILAYQGDTVNPTFIFALAGNSTEWQTGSNDSNQSDLPQGLTDGVNAVAAGSGTGPEDEFDNVYYTGITSGTRSAILAAVATASNWVGDNTASSPITSNFTVVPETSDPSLLITAPANGATLDATASVDIQISVSNFNVASEGGGDGFIKWTLNSVAQTDKFDIENETIAVASGNTYTVYMELVDNSGNPLSTPVNQTITFDVAYPCDLQLGTITTTCDALTVGSDTFNGSIAFTGGNTGATYTITASVGRVGGDNPDNTAEGIITVTDIPEGTDVEVTIVGTTSSTCNLTRDLFSPACIPFPIEEFFDYTENSDLSAQTLWQNNSTSTDEIQIVPGTIGNPYSSSQFLDPTGNMVSFAGGGSDSYIEFNQQNSGAVYASFIFTATDMTGIQANGGYFVILSEASGSFRGRIWLRPDSGDNTRFNVGLGSSSDPTYHSVAHVPGEEIFVVMAYDFSSTEFKAWINPDPSTFMNTEPRADLTFVDDTVSNLGRFNLRQDSDTETPPINFDELRISTSWSEVTPTGSTASVTDNPIEGFSAYPNPVINHTVSIASNSSATKTIVLYNVLGKEVFNQKVNGLTNIIDVSKIQSGIYILKVTQGDSISTRKLVIQ